MEGIHRLVGNRLALAGAVLYFLEWVAIAFIPEVGDGSLLGDDPAAVVEAYRPRRCHRFREDVASETFLIAFDRRTSLMDQGR